MKTISAKPTYSDPEPQSDFYFDQAEADRWVDWFELYLTHVKGELGQQFIKLQRWQKEEWIEPLFGWKRKNNNTRKYRTAFIYLPRKQGKTIITAGIGLGMIAIDGEYGAEGYICAATEDQARTLFDMCVQMIKQNPELGEMFDHFDDYILHRETNSILRVMSGTAFGKTGSNPSFVVIDEYHEQPNFKLRGVMKTGMAARRQPLLMYITTSGEVDQEAPWSKEYDRAKKILSGVTKNDYYFALIYEADKDDPWDEEPTWKKANPGYGVSVYPDFFHEFVAEAKSDPVQRREFEQFHLNRPVEALSAFISHDEWMACTEEFSWDSLYKQLAYGGLDLGQSSDSSAFAMVFPTWIYKTVNEKQVAEVDYRVLVKQWMTEEYYKERTKDGDVFLSDYKNRGLLEVTPGNIANYALIRQEIKEWKKLFKLRLIGFDRYHAAEITTNMEEEDGFLMIDIPQGFPTMSEPTKRLKELVGGRLLKHNGDLMLAWNVQNARVEVDRKKREMVKKAAHDLKIDGLAAVLNALCVAIRQPAPPPPSKIRFV